MKRAKIIVIEGTDGSGKETQSKKVLEYLDNSNIKYMCGNIALEVIKNGCYYGYIVDTSDGMTLQ